MDGTSPMRQRRCSRDLSTEIIERAPLAPPHLVTSLAPESPVRSQPAQSAQSAQSPSGPHLHLITEVLPSRNGSGGGSGRESAAGRARFAHVGRAGRVYEVGGDSAVRDDPVKAALGDGFQLISGLPFPDAARLLARAGEGGLAITGIAGATRAGVDEIKKRGVLAVAFAKRSHESVDAAGHGFAAAVLDASRARTLEDAEQIKKLVESARASSANALFSIVLKGGERLAMAQPWLVDNAFVSALWHDGLSYRPGGRRTSPNDRKIVDARWRRLRERFPLLPLIAVDHPSDRVRADKARLRARALGFDVSFSAIDDTQHRRLGSLTAVGLREDDPTMQWTG